MPQPTSSANSSHSSSDDQPIQWTYTRLSSASERGNDTGNYVMTGLTVTDDMEPLLSHSRFIRSTAPSPSPSLSLSPPSNSPSSTAPSPPIDTANLCRINSLYILTQDLLFTLHDALTDLVNAANQSSVDQLCPVSNAATEWLRRVADFRKVVLDEVYQKVKSGEVISEEKWREVEAVVKRFKGEIEELKKRILGC